jgi:hypothetical protein
MSLAALFVAAIPGCSLILTEGPQPELHPPPQCTTSVAAPVVDTVLAAFSVTLLGLGIAAEAESSTPCTGEFCSLNGVGEGAGWVAIAAGAAVVGYQRTSRMPHFPGAESPSASGEGFAAPGFVPGGLCVGW